MYVKAVKGIYVPLLKDKMLFLRFNMNWGLLILDNVSNQCNTMLMNVTRQCRLLSNYVSGYVRLGSTLGFIKVDIHVDQYCRCDFPHTPIFNNVFRKKTRESTVTATGRRCLQVVCITVFKKGGSRELYSWHINLGYDYWPLWAREVGALLQLLPMLTIPVVAVIQTCRYLSAGPPDIFDVSTSTAPSLPCSCAATAASACQRLSATVRDCQRLPASVSVCQRLSAPASACQRLPTRQTDGCSTAR